MASAPSTMAWRVIHPRIEKPTGLFVAFAILMSSSPRQGEEEFVDRPVWTDTFSPPNAEHLDVVHADQFPHAACLCVWTSARVSQREQCQSHNGKQSDRRLQTLLGCELRILNAASRLQGFVVLLNDPAAFVPLDHTARLLEGRYRFIRQQKPFQPLLASRRVRLPHTDDPQGQGIVGVVATFLSRRSHLNRCSSNVDGRLPGLARCVRFLPFFFGRLLLPLAGHFHGVRLTQLGQRTCVLTQIARSSTGIVVSHENRPIVGPRITKLTHAGLKGMEYRLSRHVRVGRVAPHCVRCGPRQQRWRCPG